jgi:hypothetical protein
LRRSEIIGLTKDKVDFKLRSVIPMHFTRVKRSGITFFTAETEGYLSKYLSTRLNDDTRVFRITENKCKELWRKVSEASGIKISPQVLRVWFSTEMEEQLIPDRFVGIFQGRAPRSVLAKHYTTKGIELLSRIYNRANLNILKPKI